MDNPFNNQGDCLCNIIQSIFSSFVGSHIHSNTEYYSPCQNADCSGMQQSSNRVIYNTQNQVMQNLNNAAGRVELSIRNLQVQSGRCQEGQAYTN